MKYYLEKQMMILPSVCDDEARLAIHSIFGLFMDIATEHAAVLRVGMLDMAAKKLFWLTAKTVVQIHRRPSMMEQVTLKTWPGPVERTRVWRYYTLSKGDELLVEGKTEWAVLETDTGKLHDIRTVFPPDFTGNEETACDGAVRRLNPDFSTAEEVGTYTVHSTDIDMGRHMNNAAYLRALYSMFPLYEQKQLPQSRIEVSYRTPCFEGETLELRRRETEDGLELAAFNGEDKPVLLVCMMR